ncbi:MAG: PAS domain S-box protein [Chlorobiaceae bacterium]|nr:PAS domain S-box protein [Chlorobiaceae bacterium]
MSTINFQSENNLADDPVSALMESLPDDAFIIDPKGRVLCANSLFSERSGLSPEMIIGADAHDKIAVNLHAPELAARGKTMWERAFLTGKRIVFDDEMDGMACRIAINPVRSAKGEITGMFVTIRDIGAENLSGQETQTKESSLAVTGNSVPSHNEIDVELQESKKRLSQALEAARAGVWEWDLITNENFWSDEIWPLYGLKSSDEKPSFELWVRSIHPDDRESAIIAVNEARQGETQLNIEYRVCYSDGSTHWLMSRGKPLFDHDGRAVRYIGTIIDITERKLIEDDLRVSRTRMNFILDNSHVGLWELNLSENTALCTPEHSRIFGYEAIRSDWSLDRFLSHIIEDDRARIERLIRNSIEKRESYTFECRICRVDGEVRWILVVGAFRLDRQGRPCIISGIVQDITERKLAEQALVSSEKKFRSIAEQISEMVFITAQNGVISYVSPAVETISGYRADEVIGHPFIEFIFEEDIEYAVSSFNAGFNNPKSNGVPEHRDDMLELRYNKKDGSIFFAEIHVQYYEDDAFVGYAGLIRDITARKNYEQELIESKQFLKNIYDEVNYSIFVVDVMPDGSYQFKGINPRHEELTGIRNNEVAGKKPEQFLPADVAESVTRHYDECIEAGRSIEYEESLPFKGEDSLWETVLNPVRNEGGSIFRIIGTSINITERRQIEEERAKLEVQLQQSQKMEMVGRLAGGIAHDFNNMLTVILGHTDMVLEDIDPSQPAYASFDAIRQAATRSADLTSQLLAFARKQIIIPKIIELNTAVADMLPMLGRLIGENITLIWIPGSKDTHIKIDPSQLDQILVNLCVNARDAITGNGRITIGTSVQDDETIVSKAGKPEVNRINSVTLSVSDDGHGIDQRDLYHIFEPFYTTKEHGKGTGLGLSTVYGIVKQNNGSIDCKSQSGKGTTFNINLPQHKAPVKTEEDSLRQDQSTQRGDQTILLVEDEPSIMKLCKLILERNGYKVLSFCTAMDALECAESYNGTIDLLMTDVMMPEMNGSELSKMLLAKRPELKILFVSGYTADIISHNTVLDSGINFIQKPFNPKSMMKIVYSILNPA